MTRKNVSRTAIVALTASFAACAADFTYVGNKSSSWTSPSSYSENAVPSANDTVTIAKNSVGVVTDDNFAFVASLGKIILREFGELRFDVTGERDFPVPAACYTTSSRTEGSKITKNGVGVLNLSGAKGEQSAYRADLTVNEGVLKLYAGETSGAAYIDLNNLSVASNATLVLPPYKAWTRVRGKFITVAGTVHCPFAGTPSDATPDKGGGPLLQTHATEGEISGRLTGNMYYRGGDSTSQSLVRLTGTNNTVYAVEAYSGATSGMTEIGFATFGAANGVPSSLGMNTTMFVGAAPSRYLYLGDGETTTKSLNWGSTSVNCEPATLDAGAHGGLVFEEPGEWMFTASSRMNHDIIVTGSNAVECCWNGRFAEARTAGGEDLSTFIIKRGTGTWHFGHNIRKRNQGVIAVEDGTLRFDTILPVGQCCSLGLSSRLRGRQSLGEGDNVVPYAFLLGGEADSNPVFAYAGSAAASCDSRPLGVKANATLANETDFDFSFTNVFGVGEGAKTLTLAGESATAVNTLTTVTNACGTLSIAKDGAGTWTLAGEQDVNGEISVKKGTLILEKEPPHYTWFRVNILQSYMYYVANPANPEYGILDSSKQGRSATYARCVNVQEFALYDVTGSRLNLNLTTGASAAAGVWTSDLAENSAALVNGTTDGASNGRVLAEMFNDRVVNTSGCAFTAASFGASAYMGQAYPQWAVSFVMRLGDDVAEPVSFDWANCFTWPQNGRNAWYIPYALTIDASADGTHWTTINTRFTTDDTTQWNAQCDAMLAPTTTVANAWVSDNTAVSTTTGQPRPLSAGKGFALNAKTQTGGHAFERVTGYGVAPGATLQARTTGAAKISVPALAIDLAEVQNASLGAAVVDGFDFAATGSLKLLNVPSDWSGPAPIIFRNCTGVENLATWTAQAENRPRGKVTVSADGRTITYLRPGMTISFR
ncbi:MAG: autotransporter-associated beta strand repeat-containing protein [Kiritimatiellae bacterium]|nr:autotransporter-associated beta strand repeat-containing protein [Kiritimatiellia bacterium]